MADEPNPATPPPSVDRDLGPALRINLEVFHPKDANQEYVVRVYDGETNEIEGTLFSKEDHTGASFGSFMEQYLDSKGF